MNVIEEDFNMLEGVKGIFDDSNDDLN